MKVALASFLGFPAVWLLSALLHMIDPDIGGVAGLAAPNVLLSVTAIACVFALLGLLPLLAYRAWRIWGYGAGLLVASGLVGCAIAAAGSGATNASGWLVSFAGVTLVCLVVFLLASLPGVLALRQSPGYHA